MLKEAAGLVVRLHVYISAGASPAAEALRGPREGSGYGTIVRRPRPVTGCHVRKVCKILYRKGDPEWAVLSARAHGPLIRYYVTAEKPIPISADLAPTGRASLVPRRTSGHETIEGEELAKVDVRRRIAAVLT